MNAQPICEYCGVQFQSPHFLEKHQDKGCDMQEDDSDVETADNTTWTQLVNQAYDEHDKLYEEKALGLESDGMTVKEAGNRVSEMLMPKYRRSLIRIYKKLVGTMHGLSKNCQHREIMQMVNWYVHWKDYSFEKAMDITLQKKRHLFKDLLEEESGDSEEAEDGPEKEEEQAGEDESI
jgi:hypothetical protein